MNLGLNWSSTVPQAPKVILNAMGVLTCLDLPELRTEALALGREAAGWGACAWHREPIGVSVWLNQLIGGGLRVWVQPFWTQCRAEHFSSHGTNIVSVSMPAWALGSLWALPWKQGVNFSLIHVMCSACLHNLAFCMLNEDTVGSDVDQLVIWGINETHKT